MKRLPALFIGHGNPMHAISDDAFTRFLRRLGEEIPRPTAITCISAHWMTEGAQVTHMPLPRTIHDFRGFPQALFDVRYPAAGSPKTAELIASALKDRTVILDDDEWGLDHGTWSVLRHMYPDADVPVVQVSIDLDGTPRDHFTLGRLLRPLREQGVLIVGSGNIVHNLRTAKFEEGAKPYSWAVELDEWIKQRLISREFEALLADPDDMPNGRLGIPTPDHWYPFLAALGAAGDDEPVRFEYEGIENASISMLSVSYGKTVAPRTSS